MNTVTAKERLLITAYLVEQAGGEIVVPWSELVTYEEQGLTVIREDDPAAHTTTFRITFGAGVLP